MVKAQAGILEGDTAGEAARKLAEAVAVARSRATEADWVDGPSAAARRARSEIGAAGESRGETFAAWRRFFEALG